jgi:hypothetical protein
MAPPRLKSLALRCSMLLLSLLVTFCLIEVVLREIKSHVKNQKAGGIFSLARPDELINFSPRGRRLRPNVNAVIENHYLSKLDVPIKTNSFGFRSNELNSPKPSYEYRALVLGDSVTLADHLQVEMSHIKIAEQLLQQADPKIHLINAGVGDIGIKEAVDILEETVVKTKPDLVVLSIYLNDSRPSWGFNAESRHRGWLRRHSLLLETIYSHVELNNWIQKTGEDRFAWISATEKLAWRTDPNAFSELVTTARWDWGSIWLPEEQGKIIAEIQRAQRAVPNETPLSILILPVAFQVKANFVEDTPQRFLATEAKKLGIKTADTLPALRNSWHNNPNNELFYDQCHLTEAGSRVVAKELISLVESSKPHLNDPTGEANAQLQHDPN